jgi:hypothetical protein
LIDTNDHGDEQNVNYEETHRKEYGQPNLNGQSISIQEGESPSRRNIYENIPINMNSNILKLMDCFSTALHILGSSSRAASVILSFCNDLSA